MNRRMLGTLALAGLLSLPLSIRAQEAADPMLEILIAAYASRGDFMRAYCLLYARLEKDPADAQARGQLADLQTVVRLTSPATDATVRSATLGFYQFTAGRRVAARKEWTRALAGHGLPLPVRDRILRTLLLPADNAIASAR